MATPCYIQNSFASEDGLHLAKYRCAAGKVHGWQMCDLLNNAVADSSWLQRWKQQLDAATGVLIIFSEAYRQKCNSDPATACMKEAELIQNRLSSDPTLRIFAMDPGIPGQDDNAFRCLLADNETSMNQDGWLKFLNKVRLQHAARRDGLAVAGVPHWHIEEHSTEFVFSSDVHGTCKQQASKEIDFQGMFGPIVKAGEFAVKKVMKANLQAGAVWDPSQDPSQPLQPTPGRLDDVEQELAMLAKCAKNLNKHVVRLVATGGRAEAHYLVLEWGGLSLQEHRSLAAGGRTERQRYALRFSEQERQLVLTEVVEAVAAVHALGIAHLDLSLDNIVARYSQESRGITVKLIDFGCAQMVQKSSDQAFAAPKLACLTQAPGKLAYMAPEIFAGAGDVGLNLHAADVWSLGLIMIFLLVLDVVALWSSPDCHDLYFRALESCMKEERLDPLIALAPSLGRLSRTAKKLTMQMLAIKPEWRPSVHSVMTIAQKPEWLNCEDPPVCLPPTRHPDRLWPQSSVRTGSVKNILLALELNIYSVDSALRRLTIQRQWGEVLAVTSDEKRQHYLHVLRQLYVQVAEAALPAVTVPAERNALRPNSYQSLDFLHLDGRNVGEICELHTWRRVAFCFIWFQATMRLQGCDLHVQISQDAAALLWKQAERILHRSVSPQELQTLASRQATLIPQRAVSPQELEDFAGRQVDRILNSARPVEFPWLHVSSRADCLRRCTLS